VKPQHLPDSTNALAGSDAVVRQAAGRGALEAGNVTLPIGPRAPGAARIVLAHWLDGYAPTRVVSDALLLVSELVSNSVLHAGATAADVIRLTFALTDGHLLIEVENPGADGVIAPREPDLVNGNGFGLNVVIALAARWGVARGRRTRVWAELAWPTRVAAEHV
jgi:anti-sigma regulatory factor (Ser/Thr protein kinase)